MLKFVEWLISCRNCTRQFIRVASLHSQYSNHGNRDSAVISSTEQETQDQDWEEDWTKLVQDTEGKTEPGAHVQAVISCFWPLYDHSDMEVFRPGSQTFILMNSTPSCREEPSYRILMTVKWRHDCEKLESQSTRDKVHCKILYLHSCYDSLLPPGWVQDAPLTSLVTMSFIIYITCVVISIQKLGFIMNAFICTA